MSDIKIVNSLRDADWQRFVTENPNGSIFHTPEMFQVFANTRGFKPGLWAAVDPSGYPLALLLPVQIVLMDSLMQKFTTRAVVFGGALWQPGAEGLQALAFLLNSYTREKKNAPIFTELRNLWDLGDGLPILQKYGFEYAPHLNYLIDLDGGPDTVFQGIGARTRKNIRHGLNRGDVLVDEIKERDQIAQCYELLEKTYENARVPLADRSLFESAFDILSSKGMIRFTQAYVGTVPVATSVELLFKDVIYGWYGGVDRAYGNYVPNEIIMWRILEWGAKNGYRVYDFGGAGKPGEKYGVRDFKAKFGGRLVSYGAKFIRAQSGGALDFKNRVSYFASLAIWKNYFQDLKEQGEIRMNEINVSIVHSLPEAEWRRFIAENSNSNIFHTPEMFQVFSLTKGYRPELWAVVMNGCVRALLLSVQVTLFDHLPKLFSTRAIIHGGVLCCPDLEGQQAMGYLLSAYVREMKSNILFTEVRNINDMKTVNSAFLENGFVYEEHLNYLIDLTKSPDELFRCINKSGRKAIKRARQRGVAVDEIHDRALIPAYYDLLMQTYRRARVPLTDISFFEAVLDILVPKGMAKMFLARVDNQDAAVSLELPFKEGIFSMFSGYDSKFRDAYTNDLIVWCILEWGEANGYHCFDFGGAGRPDEEYGPREFKAKFGGTLVNFGRYTYVHNPLALALSRFIYWFYRYIFAMNAGRDVSNGFKKRQVLPERSVSGD